VSTLDLARTQFGATTLFHFIFVPIARDGILAGAGARAVLVITHGDAGLEAFDEVLELRDGRIAARPAALGAGDP
jgi:hypothetical protein